MKRVRKAGTKRCPRCEEWKALAHFPTNKAMADGHGTYCRPCKRAADREGPRAAPILRPSKATMPKNPPPAPAAAAPPAKRRGPGQPTKLTLELVDQLCDVLRRGHTRRAACAKAGIDESTFQKWMQDAREDNADALKRTLLQSVQRAEGLGEHALVEIVRDGADIDANKAQWLLERRHSADWARKENLNATVATSPLDAGVMRELIAKRIAGLIQSRGPAGAARPAGGADGAAADPAAPAPAPAEPPA